MNRPFHPILFSIYPVLALYSVNTALVPPGDVPIPLAVTLVVALLFWGMLSLILRNAGRAAVATSLSVITLYAYGHIWNLCDQNRLLKEFFGDKEGLLWAWSLLFILVMVAGGWKWKRSEAITRGMNFFGMVLLIMPVSSIGLSWFNVWRGTTVAKASSGVASLSTQDRPDIFYIILDGYGRSDAVKRVIGFDNEWFVKGLEARGFYVPRNSRSNYCETELSLSSSLNLDYLPTLLPKIDPNHTDRVILDRLIDKSQVSSYLKGIGYRYEAVTTGFPSVHPDSADLWLRKDIGISLFEGVLLSETPLPARDPMSSMSQFDSRRIILKSAFSNLETLAKSGTQPRFIFVHILAPHPPFVFDANGGSVRPKKMGYSIVDGNHFYQNGGTREEYQAGYAGQATYISKLLLPAVDKIIKLSSKPPVIIIQGDHGSKLNLDQELLEKTDVNECFPNLNAFYVPPKVRANLYDSITPVNSFRLLFNGLFNDRFEKLPDKSYYSGWSSPFKFEEVTSRIKTRSTN